MQHILIGFLHQWYNSEPYKIIKESSILIDGAPEAYIPLKKFFEKLLPICQLTPNEIAKSKLLLDSMRAEPKDSNAKAAKFPTLEKSHLPFSKKRVGDESSMDSSTAPSKPCNYCNNLHGKEVANFANISRMLIRNISNSNKRI